jgi:protein-L-isoaspartate(D-aspartate) O-methyltransferase
MVDSQVRPNDVTEPRLQRAFETVERERFLPTEFRAQAYVDREIAYAAGRSLPTARDFAKLLAALDIRPGEVVLDVACGAGYSTAILAALAEMVVAVEFDGPLAAKAQEAWSEAGIVNAALIAGDPVAGVPRQGPYDAIVIAAAIEIEPTALLKQLRDGGRLGGFRRSNGVAKGVVWRRSGAAFAAHEIFDASVKTTLTGFTKPKAFVF